MTQPQSQQAYDSIIEALGYEFGREIGRGETYSIARQLVAQSDVVDGKPVVDSTPVYEGGPVSALDSPLYPLTVLQYTRSDSLTKADRNDRERAIKSLQSDLIAVYNETYADGEGEGEGDEEPEPYRMEV